jgi:hypothetical protein
MKYNEINKSSPLIGLFSVLVTIFLLSTGCVVHESYGDPYPWSPAHSYRAKHHYRYYPSFSLYFDIDRNLYFYHEGGKWKRGKSYPHGLQQRDGGFVSIDMDTDKPYKWHSDVEKRYPRDYRSDHHEGRKNEKDGRREDRSRDRN